MVVVDVRTPFVTLRRLLHNHEAQSRWQTCRFPRLALRAIGFADVRSGIPPPQSGYRFAIAFAGLQMQSPQAAHGASAVDGAGNSGMTIQPSSRFHAFPTLEVPHALAV